MLHAWNYRHAHLSSWCPSKIFIQTLTIYLKYVLNTKRNGKIISLKHIWISHCFLIYRQYMSYSTIVYQVKMKYGSTNNNIFGRFVKHFFEPLIYFIKGRICASNYKFSNKNDILCAWRDFNETFCGISTYHKWKFKLQISSIFNFDRAHQSWISGVLGVNCMYIRWFRIFLDFKVSRYCEVYSFWGIWGP